MTLGNLFYAQKTCKKLLWTANLQMDFNGPLPVEHFLKVRILMQWKCKRDSRRLLKGIIWTRSFPTVTHKRRTYESFYLTKCLTIPSIDLLWTLKFPRGLICCSKGLKYIRGTEGFRKAKGLRPCKGLLSLEDFLTVFSPWETFWRSSVYGKSSFYGWPTQGLLSIGTSEDLRSIGPPKIEDFFKVFCQYKTFSRSSFYWRLSQSLVSTGDLLKVFYVQATFWRYFVNRETFWKCSKGL